MKQGENHSHTHLIKETKIRESGGTGFQPVKELRVYRRNLPHWELPESVYFITFRTAKNVILFEEARNIVFDSIIFHKNKKYKLYAFVIMPDHVHLILQPLEKTKDAFYSLAEVLHSVKSYSANQINRLLRSTGKMPVPPRVWLDENFDRIIRNNHEFWEKMNYIRNNPVKSGIIERPENYKWLYVLE